MQIQKPQRALLGVALAAAALLSACGGGGESAPPRAAIEKVYVAGDSLADVGTFGMKFTVQNAEDAGGFPIFPEIVAANYGIEAQCNFYVFSGTFAPNATEGCTNFAVGGATIVNTTPGDPRGVPVQLATAAQARGGAWADSDLIIVDGGGNDVKDVVVAYLTAPFDSGAAFQAQMLKQLEPGEFAAAMAGGAGAAATLYMQRTADTYYKAIKANLLDKGATHVAVLNVPDVTLTPLFGALLDNVEAQSDAAAADQLQADIRGWITALNDRLAERIDGDERVALVDFYADITDEIANPASYALTNVEETACPITGVDGSGLPTWSLATCTSDGLDATPPAGESAGWWRKWAFADGFHPTPFAHSLLASSVSRAIARAGWL